MYMNKHCGIEPVLSFGHSVQTQSHNIYTSKYIHISIQAIPYTEAIIGVVVVRIAHQVDLLHPMRVCVFVCLVQV